LQTRHVEMETRTEGFSGSNRKAVIQIAEIGVVTKQQLAESIFHIEADNDVVERFISFSSELQHHTLTASDPRQLSAFFVENGHIDHTSLQLAKTLGIRMKRRDVDIVAKR